MKPCAMGGRSLWLNFDSVAFREALLAIPASDRRLGVLPDSLSAEKKIMIFVAIVEVALKPLGELLSYLLA